jgi:glycosyltransferase involved in cell wall biosynthesis
MKKLLVFFSANKQTVSLESHILELSKLGFDMYFLTSCEEGILHKRLREKGIKCYTSPMQFSNSINTYIFNFFYVIYFIIRNQVNFVFPHLHTPCLISSFAQYFVSAKFIFFRHNSSVWNNQDLFNTDINKNERIVDSIINRMAKKITVPSDGVKNYMITHENVNASKIEVLHYMYDFSMYNEPSLEVVEKIREQYTCNLLLIMVSRMVKHKRHIIVLEAVNHLIKEGYDIKMLLLDEGPELIKLKNYVRDNKLEKHVFFIGFVQNFIDYMQASDLLVQPSMTDASNSVAKEMGLLSKAIMVSEGVGDYSEYVVHGENGILIPTINSKECIEKELKRIYNKEYDIISIGKKLRETIFDTFSKSKLEEEYITFIKNNLLYNQ